MAVFKTIKIIIKYEYETPTVKEIDLGHIHFIERLMTIDLYYQMYRPPFHSFGI